jgi:hypothetical protein
VSPSGANPAPAAGRGRRPLYSPYAALTQRQFRPRSSIWIADGVGLYLSGAAAPCGNPAGESMLDLIFVLAGVALFLAATWYATACERL